MNDGPWYWCLDHARVEGADTHCPPDHRLGPFATEADAANWKETYAARNRAWDEDDGDGDDDETNPVDDAR